MEQQVDFKGLVRKTRWKIIRQFCLNLVIAYILPILTINFNKGAYSAGEGIAAFIFNIFSWIYICIALIVIVSVNMTTLLRKIKQEMDIVYHKSMWLTAGDSSPKLTLHEFIETNRHIESMQEKIQQMLQMEKEQKEDVLFRVSAMAHDLRTPLTVIKGNSELLQYSPLSDADERCLKDIEKASNQLENYFNQLINYSQTFYETQISLNFYSVTQLSAMIEQECSYLIGEGIDYTYHSSLESNGQVQIDLDLIIRALTNVLTNAIAYADESEKKIRICLEATKDFVTLSIWNNGPAFSEALLENFGKLFYREDTSRSYQTEHFGIGLAFVKQVMSLHSGEMKLQNRDGGALVQLLIPINLSAIVD